LEDFVEKLLEKVSSDVSPNLAKRKNLAAMTAEVTGNLVATADRQGAVYRGAAVDYEPRQGSGSDAAGGGF
jgi:hypothetical protein